MNPEPILQLAEKWASKAEEFREWGADGPADALDSVAEELRSQVREWLHEPLSLDEAAAESGYSRDHLGRLVREGEIPNVGKDGRPRVRREDLPRKPGEPCVRVGDFEAEGAHSVASRTQVARSVLESD